MLAFHKFSFHNFPVMPGCSFKCAVIVQLGWCVYLRRIICLHTIVKTTQTNCLTARILTACCSYNFQVITEVEYFFQIQLFGIEKENNYCKKLKTFMKWNQTLPEHCNSSVNIRGNLLLTSVLIGEREMVLFTSLFYSSPFQFYTLNDFL